MLKNWTRRSCKILIAPDISGTVTAASTLTMPAFTLGGMLDVDSQTIVNTNGIYGDGANSLILYANRSTSDATERNIIFYTINEATNSWVEVFRCDANGASPTLKLAKSLELNGQAFEAGSGNAEITTTGSLALKMGGGVLMAEIADAVADVAGYGQFWVHDDTPNTPWFTGDTGVDLQLATLTGTETLTNKTLGAVTLGGTLSGGNNDLGTQASPVGSIIAENNKGIYFLDSSSIQRLSILLDGTNKFRIRNYAGGSLELSTDNASGAGNQATRLTMTGSVALSTVTWTSIAAYTIACASYGVLGHAAQAQQTHIVDANGGLDDITTKFNTLLADLEGYGFLADS